MSHDEIMVSLSDSYADGNFTSTQAHFEMLLQEKDIVIASLKLELEHTLAERNRLYSDLLLADIETGYWQEEAKKWESVVKLLELTEGLRA